MIRQYFISMFMDKKIVAPGMAGKRHTDESKAQMSAAHKAQWARYYAEAGRAPDTPQAKRLSRRDRRAT
jgi:hypothetical protein